MRGADYTSLNPQQVSSGQLVSVSGMRAHDFRCHGTYVFVGRTPKINGFQTLAGFTRFQPVPLLWSKPYHVAERVSTLNPWTPTGI